MANLLCVVTGGAQGIGLAIVEELLDAKATVYFLDVNEEQGRKSEKQLQSKYPSNTLKFLKCDVGNGKQLEAAIRGAKKEMGGLNVLCNNAGFGVPFYDTSRWENEVDVNLKAPIRGIMLGLELMGTDKAGSGGVIVNTASIAGLNAVPLFPTYCAAKAGILAYTRCVAPISMLSKVRINSVCPDATDTPAFRDELPKLMSTLSEEKFRSFLQFTSSSEEEQKGISTNPQSPKDVAKCVMKLIQDPTKNGETWVVSKNLGTYCHNF